MEGKQKLAHEQTMDIVNKIQADFYGHDDDFDDDSFFDDFEDIYDCLETANLTISGEMNDINIS